MAVLVDYEGRVLDEPRGQEAKGWGPLYRLYKASDRWFFLAAQRPGDLARLTAIEGLNGIEKTPGEELASVLAARFAEAPAAAWCARRTAAELSAHVLMER